jgi:hypothetical protein
MAWVYVTVVLVGFGGGETGSTTLLGIVFMGSEDLVYIHQVVLEFELDSIHREASARPLTK